MRILALGLVALAVVAGCSNDPEPSGRPSAAVAEPAALTTVPFEESSFSLNVSNQSFDNPDVLITGTIDGTAVFAQVFPVGGQHTVFSFPMALPPGRHLLRLVADDGTQLGRVVTVPPEGRRYAHVSYWGAVESTRNEPFFQFTAQDEPFGYG